MGRSRLKTQPKEVQDIAIKGILAGTTDDVSVDVPRVAETTAGPAPTTPLTDLARECDTANDAVGAARRAHNDAQRLLANALVELRNAEIRAAAAKHALEMALKNGIA
jgi:hypothetical protein